MLIRLDIISIVSLRLLARQVLELQHELLRLLTVSPAADAAFISIWIFLICSLRASNRACAALISESMPEGGGRLLGRERERADQAPVAVEVAAAHAKAVDIAGLQIKVLVPV